jgi:transposase-like protein
MIHGNRFTYESLSFLEKINELNSIKTGTRLFVGDKCLGLLEAVNTVFLDAKYQRCTVHFYRNVFTVVPRSKVKEVAAMQEILYSQQSD